MMQLGMPLTGLSCSWRVQENGEVIILRHHMQRIIYVTHIVDHKITMPLCGTCDLELTLVV